jgi:hypothetical protein
MKEILDWDTNKKISATISEQSPKIVKKQIDKSTKNFQYSKCFHNIYFAWNFYFLKAHNYQIFHSLFNHFLWNGIFYGIMRWFETKNEWNYDRKYQ